MSAMNRQRTNVRARYFRYAHIQHRPAPAPVAVKLPPLLLELLPGMTMVAVGLACIGIGVM